MKTKILSILLLTTSLIFLCVVLIWQNYYKNTHEIVETIENDLIKIENEDKIPECKDGKDNDLDKLTDLDDPGCEFPADNSEDSATTKCQDKEDNDKDGLIDLLDPDCKYFTDNETGEKTSACQDKIDNDNDGLTDLDDPDCTDELDHFEQSSPIAIYSDTRSQNPPHRAIVKRIIDINPHTVFHIGDMVNDGDKEKDWEKFFGITKEMRKNTNFYPALGGHDKHAQIYFDNFDLPNNERWYSVKINEINFIILESNYDLNPESEQYKWLKSELEKNKNKHKFTIILYHETLFSTGKHPEDRHGNKKYLIPLFEENNVDIVFTSENHGYERSKVNNIYYIVTAGGGAPLYDKARESLHSQVFAKKFNFVTLDIKDNKLEIKVWDLGDEVIDELYIEQIHPQPLL